MRALVIAVVLSSSMAMAKGKGAAVDLDFKQVELGYVLRLLGDTGRFNVVILEGADTKIDVQAKRVPWDDVLEDVIKRANLAYVRQGNLYIVGAPAFIEERKKAKKRTYTGRVVDVDLVGVDAPDAARLLSAASAKAIRLDGGTKPVTFRLMRMPIDLAQEMIMLVTGATVPDAKPEVKVPEPKPAKDAAKPKVTCAAARMPVGDLEPIGIVGAGTKRWALLGTKTTAETFVISQTDCVGVEGVKVKDIGSGFVSLENKTEWMLHPAPAP